VHAEARGELRRGRRAAEVGEQAEQPPPRRLVQHSGLHTSV
jgi:hypothetical protein